MSEPLWTDERIKYTTYDNSAFAISLAQSAFQTARTMRDEYQALVDDLRGQLAELTAELGQKQEYILRLEAKNDSNAIVAAYRKGYSNAIAALTPGKDTNE